MMAATTICGEVYNVLMLSHERRWNRVREGIEYVRENVEFSHFGCMRAK